jgi:hypothetical protein
VKVGFSFDISSAACGLAPIGVRLGWTGSGLDITGIGLDGGVGLVEVFVGSSAACGLVPIGVRLGWTDSGLDIAGTGLDGGGGLIVVTVQP